jgi:hypothetical protein
VVGSAIVEPLFFHHSGCIVQRTETVEDGGMAGISKLARRTEKARESFYFEAH